MEIEKILLLGLWSNAANKVTWKFKNLKVRSYATPTMYAFQASCCSKCFISSYFMSLLAPKPTVLLFSPVSGICRSQKWTDWNPASPKQSLISGNDHLGTWVMTFDWLKIYPKWANGSYYNPCLNKNQIWIQFLNMKAFKLKHNLQSPAVRERMAQFLLLLLEMKVEANPCFPLNNIKFSLLPYILHML